MILSKHSALLVTLAALGAAAAGCSSSSDGPGTAAHAVKTTSGTGTGGGGGAGQGGGGGAGTGGAGTGGATSAGGQGQGGAGGSGGTSAGGAGGSGGAGPECGAGFSVCDPVFAAFTKCGGDPTGTWAYVDYCQKPKLGKVDPKCPTGVQEGAAVDGAGTITFDGQGTATLASGAVFTGVYHMAAPVSCIAPLDCAAYEQALKNQLPDACCAQTGDICDCLATTTSTTDQPQTDTYAVAGETLTLGSTDYEFCVDGADLWIRFPGDADAPEMVQHLQKQ